MSISPVNKTVIVVAVTADQLAVCVRITGYVDLVGEPDLASLTRHLAATKCARVHIDLAEITFAGATLFNFVFRLVTELPEHVSVILCRPKALIQHIIQLTALDRCAVVRCDLPPGWTTSLAHAGAPAPSLASA